MVYSNAKGETPGTRGDEAKSEYDFDSDQPQRIRSASTATRNQSFGIDRKNWQGSNSGRFDLASTDPVPGGILRQLIAQTDSQKAHRVKEVKRLEEEIQELDAQASEWKKLLEAVEALEKNSTEFNGQK